MENGKPKIGGCGWWCPWCASWIPKEHLDNSDIKYDVRYHDVKKGGCNNAVSRRRRVK